jgi:hypothetical protein
LVRHFCLHPHVRLPSRVGEVQFDFDIKIYIIGNIIIGLLSSFMASISGILRQGTSPYIVLTIKRSSLEIRSNDGKIPN